jgi:diguanylate cyclase (GGDEF)-like protein/PAS domain S-box-containing protein
MLITMDAATLESDYDRLLEFLYLIPVGVIRFGADGCVQMANPAAARLLLPLSNGRELADLFALLEYKAPDLRTAVQASQATGGQVCHTAVFAVEAAGTVLSLDVHKVSDEMFIALVEDITRTVEQDRRIRESEARLQAILDNVRDYAIYTLDLEGRVDQWNRSLYRLSGWREDDVLGQSASMFLADAVNREATQADLMVRALRTGSAEIEDWRMRRSGSRFWGSCALTVLPDADGIPKGFVVVTRDLTHHKTLEEKLQALATTDPLTSALNRRAGDEALAREFATWERDGTRFSVLLVDCDHFKAVNDRYGHSVGDQVLVAVVQACRLAVRAVDPIVRMGGEEFLVLLAGSALDEAVVVAERLRGAIAAMTVRPDLADLRVTVSVGASACTSGDTCVTDVVKRADLGLYQAKRNGRNQVYSLSG